MKTLKLLLFTVPILTAIGCNRRPAPELSGLYVAGFRNEYTITADTLIVTAQNLEFHTYQIERRTGFRKLRNGYILPKAYKQSRWLATFNPDKQALQETDLGRQLYVSEKRHIRFGDTDYRPLQ